MLPYDIIFHEKPKHGFVICRAKVETEVKLGAIMKTTSVDESAFRLSTVAWLE